ncbi:helix-turn-helix domain-containing protein [Actinomadura logoneensis]|uniref:Helix-turn-helix domain-containing protein n=1 Tax=Actinomadura logoneensis TaxID=2293572 RepID=A0A372JEW2_9ACTN|nr:helix-turn-helix domain-containing protein [Actinomadura logoneensis]RFU38553.1 helix-turn-helix domain-containing protein [Actinomadura logoneensis]
MQGPRLRRDVTVLRWPAESERRELCRERGLLRLLVVERDHEPPICADVREDWIRMPATQRDFQARIAMLRARGGTGARPHLDQDGILRHGRRSVAVSPSEARLLHLLVRRYGRIAAREELRALLAEDGRPVSRNALDLHIKRIRRRVRPLGLTLRTAWGRGYVLEADDSGAP